MRKIRTDPSIIQDILSLIDEYVEYAIIETWTETQRVQVCGWAGRVFAAASDNNVRVPRRPVFMPEKKALQPDLVVGNG